MGVEENIAVVRATDEALMKQDWDALGKLHANSVIVHSPMSPEPTKGRDAHIEGLKELVSAFPDMSVTEVRTFGEGDWVCGEVTMKGTHKGPLPGPAGQLIPPTNKPFRIDLCTVFKLEGGEITEEHTYFDLAGMMTQLGLMPEGGP